MTSSHAQDGPSGHELPQASTSTPAPPLPSSPSATVTAPALPSQQDAQGGVDEDDPATNNQDLEPPESTNVHPNDPSSVGEPAAPQDAPVDLYAATLDQVIASQYPGSVVNQSAIEKALFGSNPDRTGLSAYEDATFHDPDHYNLPASGSAEYILGNMRNANATQPPPPLSVSQQQLLDLSGWNTINSIGFPSLNQHEGIEPDDDDEEDDEEGHVYNSGIFGKLELPDTDFWITTRAVLIGRDNKLYKEGKQQHDYQQKVRDNLAKGLDPPEAPSSTRRRYQASYVSEEGGALGPESDDDEDPRPAKRRKTAAAGKVYGQQRDATHAGSHVISSRQYFENTRPVDVNTLRPSNEVVPRLNIHGSGSDLSTIFQRSKGISRDHLRIQYNSDKKVWEAVVLGRNGLFRRDPTLTEENDDSFHLHSMGEVVTLRSGDDLQIQEVPIRFTLTGIDQGKTGAEIDSTYSENGKEMSFDFQSSRGEEMRDTDDSSDGGSEIRPSEELADRAVVDSDDSDDSDEGMDDAPSSDKVIPGDEDNEDAEEEIRDTVESDQLDENLKPDPSLAGSESLAQIPLPPKKRGPGRPPKNGIMSKREERLLKKQAQEEAKKNMPTQESGEQPQKRKVGRPRKHPLPESAEGQPEKRKYKPRKSKGEEGEDDLEGEKPAKEKSQKHKTPPLELKREDFTEEQLQKPTKNYQMLIDEIMSAAPPKGYSLKQVYKRIQEKWPFFYFCVDTKGWESSVRHNLLGSECFKKIDGNWHRVPGVPLESGKKRKPSDSTAEPRPAGMYNGYGHPYQPPPHAQVHGHQPITHSTGLSQPNLPPRYPPNGQAYQIHQGPPPNPAQTGGTPNQQGLPRPGFPQQQMPITTPQASGYAAAGAPPRLQYQGTQPPPYNPAYGNRPQLPHVGNPSGPGPTAGQIPAQRPPVARAGLGPPGVPQPQTALQTPHTTSSNVPRPAPPPSSQQSMATSTTPAPLAPVIEPLLRNFVREFRVEVIKQLQAKEGKRSEAVAMSVINRGLGLTERSLVPECEAYEKLILTVFHQHKKTYPKLRAEAVAKAASVSSTVTPSARTPSANGNRPTAAAPATGPTTTTPSPFSGATRPVVNAPSALSGQPNKSVSVTNGDQNGAINRGVVKDTPGTATSVAPRADPSGPAPRTSTTASSNVPASASAGAAPSAPTTTGFVPTASSSTGTLTNAPVAASAVTPKPSSAGPASSTSVTAGSAASAPVIATAGAGSTPSSSTAPAASMPAGATSMNPKSAVGAPVSHAAMTAVAAASKATSAEIVTTVAASTPAPTPRPASMGPNLSSNGPAGSATARPATASPAPKATPGAGSVHGGASKPASSAPVSAASGPTPNGPRATPSTPGTPAPPDSSQDVELLDPKLVTVILSFKKAILPTLAERLDHLLGESLIMSAVDRLLGFTDDTFVHAKTEQQQKNFAEAEKALMKHLETRIQEYVRTRSAPR